MKWLTSGRDFLLLIVLEIRALVDEWRGESS